jgi:hypothetical protein
MTATTYLKALFYGDPGAGKTYLIGTAMECPDTRPLLVLDARGQPVTLRLFSPPPCVVPVNDLDALSRVYEWLAAGQPEGKAPFPVIAKYLEAYYAKYEPDADRRIFRTVAIDSLTYVQRLALRVVTPGSGTRSIVEPPAPMSYGEWGKVLAVMTSVADAFYSLQMNVLTTALARRDELPTYGITMITPFMWGQSSVEVPSYAELVGFLVAVESPIVREVLGTKVEALKSDAFNVLLTRGGRAHVAKWQGIKNPPHVVAAPSVTKLVTMLRGGGGGAPSSAS